MSFSWWCRDKHGKDLFDEFDVNGQALGLGPNTMDASPAPNSVMDIRIAWMNVPYKDKLADAARDAVGRVQAMALGNKESLTPGHCESCTCPAEKPVGWSVEEVDKLLAIPLDRVWRAGGGY